MTHLHQEASPWGQDSRLVHLRKNKQTKTQKNMTSMASPAPASNRCLPGTCGVESGAPRSCRGHLPPPSTGPSPPQLGFRLTLAPPPGSHLQAFARTALEHCPLQLPRPERHPGLSSNVTSRPHLGPVPASEQPPTGGGALTHGWGRGDTKIQSVTLSTMKGPVLCPGLIILPNCSRPAEGAPGMRPSLRRTDPSLLETVFRSAHWNTQPMPPSCLWGPRV